jgi:formylmethanofuran dehydrogenase subunit E
MSDRLSLKIQPPAADRFERFRRDHESQTETMTRLLDAAGVPEILRCNECDDPVQAHVRDEEGRILCPDCAGVPEILRCNVCDDPVQTHVRDEEGRILCPDCAGVSPETTIEGAD